MKNTKKNADALSAQLDKINPSKKKSFEKDERFWYPELDKSGNGYALIRFLPPPQNEDLPIIRYYHHSFQGPTKAWYIENSLTTFERPDPVGEFNSQLWNTGTKENQDQARKQKRKLQFVANVLVLNDKANPDNNGKVFLYKFGKKIFDKVNAMMFPKFEDVKRVDPFDFQDGANFRLVISKVEGFSNYDESKFDSPSPLALNDKVLSAKELETIWNSQHSLAELLSDKHFKSYEELEKRLKHVLGNGKTADSESGRTLGNPIAKNGGAVKESTPIVNLDDDGDEISFDNLNLDD